ncbi:hypothetical protein HYH03_000031 [Edaphochlamys debaryana]|uniref:Uncharacterized protein n=1 Tax=Edaphochlamys debaryana TaxID=47281 RepID=A0A835YGU8_9CHLO|nr:hypothetical protein HYH03_000031 [Edaphochlamys debaryana]|eukprot:KAG2501524.1 hypothetical protein HYH03_000031 [Edaphochlamys debaryana]
MDTKLSKMNKTVSRLETRVADLYEFTALPLISNHFNHEFAESVDIKSAAGVVDHILSLALNLDVPGVKNRSSFIAILEEYVLKDRQGLRTAIKSLMDEVCDEEGVCMMALPSNFASAPWDDIRACLQELALAYAAPGSADERINNLMRLVDALETGAPPRPLPGFMEMATAMSSGRVASHMPLDCRGRIDVRETFIEFHIGAFKGSTSGLTETLTHLKRTAALFAWAYRVIEPHIFSATSGPASNGAGVRQPRDVEAIGYAFTIGKVAPQDSQLKLYDEFTVDVYGKKSNTDIAYRYFSVRPTGLTEHYAKV